MKLAIVGSRGFTDYDMFKKRVQEVEKLDGKITEIISGGASGADTLAERYADEFNIPKDIKYAEWEKHGRVAGFIRNTEIVKACDNILVFWDGKSKGTKDTLEKAHDAQKPLRVTLYDPPDDGSDFD